MLFRSEAPPPSAVPSIADGTLVEPEAIGFPAIPGAGVARACNDVSPPGDWVDPVDAAGPYRPLVCKVDSDGNEVAGVRTPDIAVPLGTHTGWNLYDAPYPAGELADRDGSFIPFTTGAVARQQIGDPRPSLQERYRDAADYLARVEAVADRLLAERLLLPEDAAAYVAKARTTAARIFSAVSTP